jgi:hypothetical protein
MNAAANRPGSDYRFRNTWHRDGTVTYWSVYEQQWIRRARRIPDREVAAWPAYERERWIKDGTRAAVTP